MNWKQKLTSRKFWAAVIGFTTAVAMAVGYDAIQIEQMGLVLGAFSALVAYIVGEGLVDVARIRAGGNQNEA